MNTSCKEAVRSHYWGTKLTRQHKSKTEKNITNKIHKKHSHNSWKEQYLPWRFRKICLLIKTAERLFFKETQWNVAWQQVLWNSAARLFTSWMLGIHAERTPNSPLFSSTLFHNTTIPYNNNWFMYSYKINMKELRLLVFVEQAHGNNLNAASLRKFGGAPGSGCRKCSPPGD